MQRQEFNAFEPFRPPDAEDPAGGADPKPFPGAAPGDGGRQGRAPGEYLPAYLISGVLLLVMAGAVIAWVVRGLSVSGIPFSAFVRAFFDASAVPVSPWLLGAHEWALALALLAVATGLLFGRRLARGGALLLATLLLVVAARQAFGALDEGYRTVFSEPELGGWMAATYAAAGLVGLVVLLLLAPAGAGSDDRDLPRGFDPYGPRRRDARRTWAGALTVAVAAVAAAWIIGTQARLVHRVDAATWGEYARSLVDPSATGGGFWGADHTFYAAAVVLALLAGGTLLLTDRPAGRGLALTALAVSGYLLLRDAVAVDYQRLDFYLEGTRSALWLLSTLGSLAVSAVAALLLLLPQRRTPERAGPPDWYPADGGPDPDPGPPGAPGGGRGGGTGGRDGRGAGDGGDTWPDF